MRRRRRARPAFERDGEAVRGEEKSRAVGEGRARALPSKSDRLQVSKIHRIQERAAQDERRKNPAASAARRKSCVTASGMCDPRGGAPSYACPTQTGGVEP